MVDPRVSTKDAHLGQILSFSRSFRQKFGKVIDWCTPLRSWCTPLGNPGPATVLSQCEVVLRRYNLPVLFLEGQCVVSSDEVTDLYQSMTPSEARLGTMSVAVCVRSTRAPGLSQTHSVIRLLLLVIQTKSVKDSLKKL